MNFSLNLLGPLGKTVRRESTHWGNLDLLKSEHMVAIIGSRKATRAGNSKAYELGLSYAKRGYVVVSGLALGCDAAAHRGGTMHRTLCPKVWKED